MAKASPTQRALAECKKQGWTAAICEKWNPHSKTRLDLFGFADLVVLRPSFYREATPDELARNDDGAADPMWVWADGTIWVKGTIVAVQVTSGSNHAARRTKILAEPRAKLWCDCGGVVEVWSYTKRKTGRYELRVEEVRPLCR